VPRAHCCGAGAARPDGRWPIDLHKIALAEALADAASSIASACAAHLRRFPSGNCRDQEWITSHGPATFNRRSVTLSLEWALRQRLGHGPSSPGPPDSALSVLLLRRAG
jgi:hypothetical protein